MLGLIWRKMSTGLAWTAAFTLVYGGQPQRALSRSRYGLMGTPEAICIPVPIGSKLQAGTPLSAMKLESLSANQSQVSEES